MRAFCQKSFDLTLVKFLIFVLVKPLEFIRFEFLEGLARL